LNLKINFVEYEKIKDKLFDNINEHSFYIESFLEDHITKSNHYEICENSNQIGYFSIFNKNIITQYYLVKEYRHFSQEIFDKIRRYEDVKKAFVPTSADFFLTNAIDYQKRIELQAYFFQDSKREIFDSKIIKNFYLKLARENDIDFIKNKSGDFFDDDELDKRISNNEIYLGYLDKEVVSIGIIEKSLFYENIASIGMFTFSENRVSGIGRNTILQLKELCYQNNYIPVAGCWYYNHNSKKTLESAGMYSTSRLLVLHF